MGPRILLTDTSRWSVGARLAIAFAKAGCEVSAVCSTSYHPLQYASVVRRIFSYSSLRPLQSLESAILKSQPQFIVPCDERAVRHLHELYLMSGLDGGPRAEVTDLIVRSLGSPGSYPIVSSRYELLKVAGGEGIRVPRTLAVKEQEDLKRWEAEQPFPWVLKADCTYGGAGVEIARSPACASRGYSQLTRLYRTTRVLKRLILNRDPFWIRPWWNGLRPSIIAQSHIEGRPANCAVACWEGELLAGIAVEVISSVGQTGPATVVRVVDNCEMMEAAKRLARRLSLSGFFGLDFMIEDATRAAYLIEMNPRCTTLCHLQLGKGRNLVGALWAQLSGWPLPEAPPVTQNGLIAYFPQAWNSKDHLLESSFQDIPHEEPKLVDELLRPWPDRTLLFRLGQVLTAPKASKP